GSGITLAHVAVAITRGTWARSTVVRVPVRGLLTGACGRTQKDDASQAGHEPGGSRNRMRKRNHDLPTRRNAVLESRGKQCNGRFAATMNLPVSPEYVHEARGDRTGIRQPGSFPFATNSYRPRNRLRRGPAPCRLPSPGAQRIGPVAAMAADRPAGSN